MKLMVKLSHFDSLSIGSLAKLETLDGSCIEIVGSEKMTPKTACKQAAKALREAAARFDLLGKDREPYLKMTRDRINNDKLLK